jgi:hypothetical protein
LFGLHEGPPGEAYQPPAWVQKLGSIHKNQTVSERRGRRRVLQENKDDRPKAMTRAGLLNQKVAGNEDRGSNKLTLALKCFFLATAVGLIFSTLLGIFMAFQYNRSRAPVWGLLLLGTAIPVTLIAIMA